MIEILIVLILLLLIVVAAKDHMVPYPNRYSGRKANTINNDDAVY